MKKIDENLFKQIKIEINRSVKPNLLAIANKFKVGRTTVRTIRDCDDYVAYRKFHKAKYAKAKRTIAQEAIARRKLEKREEDENRNAEIAWQAFLIVIGLMVFAIIIAALACWFINQYKY